MLVDEFERDPARGAFPDQARPTTTRSRHLELVANADAYLIAPASANTIAKLAAGLADNLVTTAALAARCPLLVAPAMNNQMWEHPATQANSTTLRARGVTVLEPGTGALGSQRRVGRGAPARAGRAARGAVEARRAARGAAPARRAAGARHRRRHARADRRVRYVGNRSSGRMGFALADEAAAARRRGDRAWPPT